MLGLFFAIFFGTVKFQIKDFEEKSMPEILKRSSKTGDQFTDISDLRNNEERVLFQAGNRQLSRKFSEQV